MKAALQNHLCAGQRIYADGGGLAYLCEYIETPEGPWKPMVGVLPARAHLAGLFRPPQPVEVTLAQANWLGRAGSKIRGYLNPRWRLEANGPLTSYLAEKEHEFDIVGSHQAMGSRMQVNFAAQPDFLRNFLKPVAV
jgi:cobyrinic acid a,c-diamide synthase